MPGASRTLSGLSAPRPRSTSHGLGGPAPQQGEATAASVEPTVPQPGARPPPPPSTVAGARGANEAPAYQNEPSSTIKPAASLPAAAPAKPVATEPIQATAPAPVFAEQPPAKPVVDPPQAPLPSGTPAVVGPAAFGVSQARPRRKGEGLGRAFRNDETFDSLPMDLGQAAAPPSARSTPAPRTPAPFAGDADDAEHFDTSDIPGLPKKRRYGRWVAAAIVLGGLGAAAAFAGPEKLESLWTRARAAVDPGRVERLVADGDALLGVGDLESAKERFVQAAALDSTITSVRLGLASVEVIRADHAWLKVRLADGGDVDIATRHFDAQLATAKTSVDELPARGAAALSTTRLRVDLLRISGELIQASELSNDLQGDADPNSVYTLAALQASAGKPDWAAVADRLQAPSDEHHRRAHALRIFALVKAEKYSVAKLELTALQKADQLHPLASDLTAFFSRHAPASEVPSDLPAGVADAAASAKAPAPAAAPDQPAIKKVAVKSAPDKPRARPATPKKNSSRSRPGDFRGWLEAGNDALGDGDLARAGEMFGRVLEVQPGNIEALAGLGDVARLRNQPSRAAQYYDDVLRRNPSYIPALMARGDQKWSEGDRAGAAKLYQRVVSQVGDSGGYGRRAATRLAQMKSAGSEGATAPAPEPKPTPPTPAAPRAPEAPGVDTSDLPEEGSGHVSDDGAAIDTSDLPGF